MFRELKILFVEDVQEDVELAKRTLLREGILFQSHVVEEEIDFCRALEEYSPDIVISDFTMPHFNGMKALNIVSKRNLNIPFILLTGSMNEETAVECMKAGASDYIIKEHISRLPYAVSETLKKKGIQIEKEKAELALKESEERFRSLYEHINLGLYRTTGAGQIILANPALVNMLGYQSFEELARRNLKEDSFELFYGREHFIKLLEEKEEIKGLEAEWYRKDKTIIYVRESTRAFRDTDGKLLYYDGIVEDITERKHAEMALKQKMDELQRFLNLTVGRELSMIELKKEVNALLKKNGQPEKYRIVD